MNNLEGASIRTSSATLRESNMRFYKNLKE